MFDFIGILSGRAFSGACRQNPVLMDQDASDREFSGIQRILGLFQGLFHEMFIVRVSI
jgi:hypothetical protein